MIYYMHAIMHLLGVITHPKRQFIRYSKQDISGLHFIRIHTNTSHTVMSVIGWVNPLREMNYHYSQSLHMNHLKSGVWIS